VPDQGTLISPINGHGMDGAPTSSDLARYLLPPASTEHSVPPCSRLTLIVCAPRDPPLPKAIPMPIRPPRPQHLPTFLQTPRLRNTGFFLRAVTFLSQECAPTLSPLPLLRTTPIPLLLPAITFLRVHPGILPVDLVCIVDRPHHLAYQIKNTNIQSPSPPLLLLPPLSQ
jgi:hypothetical protein